MTWGDQMRRAILLPSWTHTHNKHAKPLKQTSASANSVMADFYKERFTCNPAGADFRKLNRTWFVKSQFLDWGLTLLAEQYVPVTVCCWNMLPYWVNVRNAASMLVRYSLCLSNHYNTWHETLSNWQLKYTPSKL